MSGAAKSMGGVSVAEYRFQLAAVMVAIVSNPGARGPRFSAVVTGAGGEVIGRGEDWTEPGAVGLAVLAAGKTRAICNGCGQWFDKAELGQDAGDFWYCLECAFDRKIVKAPVWW